MLAPLRTRRRDMGSYAAATEPVSHHSFIASPLARLPAGNADATSHSPCCYTCTRTPHRSTVLAAHPGASSVEKRVDTHRCEPARAAPGRDHCWNLVRYANSIFICSFDEHHTTIVRSFQPDPWRGYSHRWRAACVRYWLGQTPRRVYAASRSACLSIVAGSGRRAAPGRSRLTEPCRASERRPGSLRAGDRRISSNLSGRRARSRLEWHRHHHTKRATGQYQHCHLG